MKLTKTEAKRFLLRHQRLDKPRSEKGKDGALGFVRGVGAVQFDPLDQVGRNPHLVLQARVAGYRQRMLDELLYTDRLLVDGFDKNLSIWPVENWPDFARNRRDARVWFGNGLDEGPLHDAKQHALAEIEARGPLCSLDFEAREKVDWPWGPANAMRAALESLYFQGRLVVHSKAGTRKYYDLAERHIPKEILGAPDPRPGYEDYLRWRVFRRAGSIGLIWDRGGDAFLGIPGLGAAERAGAFAALTASGKLTALEAEGVSRTLYMRTADLPELEQALDAGAPRPEMAFVAPLDNLIWDRALVRELFGFEYTWEVYAPREKRKYGYYVLPVLYGDRFVARFEPKYDKKAKTLRLLSWWWEEGAKPDAEMKKAFKRCLKEFMGYLGAKEVVFNEGYRGPLV
jgi:uncharacterized protein YcaQ